MTATQDYMTKVFGKDILDAMSPEVRDLVTELSQSITKFQARQVADIAKDAQEGEICMICRAKDDLVVVQLSSTEDILIDARTYCRVDFYSEALLRDISSIYSTSNIDQWMYKMFELEGGS